MRRLVVLLLIGAAVAGVVLANVALLGAATPSDDPVGRLAPSARLPAAPAKVIRPTTETVADDDSGSGHDSDD